MWGTPAGKREECSFKGKNLEVREEPPLENSSIMARPTSLFQHILCYPSAASALNQGDNISSDSTNLLIKCADSPGNCFLCTRALALSLSGVYLVVSPTVVSPGIKTLLSASLYMRWYWGDERAAAVRCWKAFPSSMLERRRSQHFQSSLLVLPTSGYKHKHFRFGL